MPPSLLGKAKRKYEHTNKLQFSGEFSITKYKALNEKIAETKSAPCLKGRGPRSGEGI